LTNTTIGDVSRVADCYKAELSNHPQSISHTYGSQTTYVDTEYTVYDIDKDGILELIIKEDDREYFVYTYDNGECKKCGEIYSEYADDLYEYNGNGLVVYVGGMGKYHFEYVYPDIHSTDAQSPPSNSRCFFLLKPFRTRS
jgi:hypothetical protein